MWFSHLVTKWRYRQLQKTLRHSVVSDTIDAAVEFVDHASNGHALMFNIYINEWVEMHFRLLYRRYSQRRIVSKNLWVLYTEWKKASTVRARAVAVGNLIIYINGLSYPERDVIFRDYIDYLRKAK